VSDAVRHGSHRRRGCVRHACPLRETRDLHLHENRRHRHGSRHLRHDRRAHRHHPGSS
jgi:hypothetical protein